MDPIDILGDLLGRKSKKAGRSGSIFDDMFGAPKPGAGPAQTGEIERQAKELEDMLDVAKQRAGTRSAPSTQRAPSPREYPWAETPDPFPGTPNGRSRKTPAQNPAPGTPRWNRPEPPQDANAQAILLIRAMVNAAKADGEISPDEQQALLERLGSQSQGAIEFLRKEIARPLDVRDFAWSVPEGMEQQVYTVSLAAMRLDSDAEAGYLLQLAHGLRIGDEKRRQIHAHYSAPLLDT